MYIYDKQCHTRRNVMSHHSSSSFIHFLDYFHLFDYLVGEVVGMVGEVIDMALENMEYLEYQ